MACSEGSKKWSDSTHILQPKLNIQFKLRESESSSIIPKFLGLGNQKGQLRWWRPQVEEGEVRSFWYMEHWDVY